MKGCRMFARILQAPLKSSLLGLLCIILLYFLSGCSPTQTTNDSDNKSINKDWRELGPEATNQFKSDSNQPTAGTANAKILEQATVALNESSRSGPDGGNLACAWMVNKILKRSVGFKVNGDSTTTMNTEFKRLVASGRAEKIPLKSAQPGDVIISPTTWSPKRNTGHVGIVGQNGSIFSNSSKNAQWESNYDMSRWLGYYKKDKGLDTFAYRILG